MGYLHHALEPLARLLVDPDMVEIAINPTGQVWTLRRHDVCMKAADLILDNRSVVQIINQIAGHAHAKTGQNHLLVSASINFEDRPVRAQAVLPPAAHGGAALSLRMFSSLLIDEVQLAYLVGKSQSSNQSKADRLAELARLIDATDLMKALQFCVDSRFNILISGGTDTGKTVVLRKILSMISNEDRILTIEDALELCPRQPNCVSLIADLSGEVRSTDQLLKASLRMRPDRLIVGEIRGKEAMTFLEAINTGHGGSMSTIHAETPQLALDRLAIAAGRSDVPMTYDNLHRYISRTIDVIIQTGRNAAMRGISEIYLPNWEVAA
ncbi:ATPase, T2SS/T4P/T4SS family [Brucella pseudogrignonensis]